MKAESAIGVPVVSAESSVVGREARAAPLQMPIVWVDLEMTGLDPRRDQILEIAVIVTDGWLRERREGPDLVLHADDSVLEGMCDWSRRHHGQSGLTEACRRATLTVRDAETQVLNFIKYQVMRGEEGSSPTFPRLPLAGNSVHVDRMFLYMYMPELCHFLHYRIIDVSSIKELFGRWRSAPPGISSEEREKITIEKEEGVKAGNESSGKRPPAKRMQHRALEDIRESIEELCFYKRHFMISDVVA